MYRAPKLDLPPRSPAESWSPRPAQRDKTEMVRAALADTLDTHGEALKALATC